MKSEKHASEEENLSDQSWELIRKLKIEAEHKSLLQDLAIESGIEDREILEKLLRFGINPRNFQALPLVPFFFMAWADGDIDHKEDDSIHEYIRSQGISLSGLSRQLVSHWFNVPPSPEYFEAWSLYIKSRLQSGDSKIGEALRKEFLQHAEHLARVSGGFLGLGPKISSAENQQLKKMSEILGISEVS